MDSVSTLRTKTANFLHTSLATWAREGYDHTHGGYVEALDFDGTPLSTRNKRFRIQGRTMFAHCAGTLWGYGDYIAVAEKTFEFVMNKCRRDDGGFVSTTAPDGTHVDSHARTYEHAFLLLGLGWLSSATKKQAHIAALRSTWSFVNTALRHTDGGFITGIPDDGAARQQNPHMHMFEAVLNLYELFHDDVWMTQANMLYSMFEKYFFHKDTGLLKEFFTDDWKPDSKRGQYIDPGHHYEWTWLLYKYQTLSGNVVPYIKTLYDFAWNHGTGTHGLGYDESYDDTRVYRDTHRLWVQTEALKSHLTMSKLAKNDTDKITYLHRADKVLNMMFEHYFISKLGIWHDQLDADLHNISQDAPTSTLYHILIALHEYLQTRVK